MNDLELTRLNDLLADRATEGLAEAERAELDQFLARPDAPADLDPEAFEFAAAALHLSALGRPLQTLPSSLKRRLAQDAEDYFQRRPATSSPSSPSRSSTALAWSGWAAAAALVALTFWMQGTGAAPTLPVRTAATLRAEFLAASGTVQRIDWSPTDDELGRGVSGDVVWSDRDQRGFMRFRGLAANDPTQSQYQLWIFDAERPGETPVDGGVFDVPAGADEIVVPIDPKLAIDTATLFAITLERPGGVVVSSRERLLVLAQPN